MLPVGIDKVTLQEAAQRLGVSEGAVRKRVKRGTLEHEKSEEGRIYVYLDALEKDTTRGVDEGMDTVQPPEYGALISQLREEIAYLRDENRRKDEIIMQQAISMRQLSAPAQESHQEPPESPETRAGEPPTPAEDGGESEEQPQGRSWWRRMFGG